MIETGEIKMPSKKMLGVLYMQYGSVWTIIAVSGIIIFIILGIVVDFRFLFLALIWLFLFIPLVTAFLYFYYGMDPLTAFNTIPHKIHLDTDGMKVEFIPIHPENEEPSAPTLQNKEYNINLADYHNMKTGPDYLLLFFGKKGWLWLPADCFTNREDMKLFIEKLNER